MSNELITDEEGVVCSSEVEARLNNISIRQKKGDIEVEAGAARDAILSKFDLEKSHEEYEKARDVAAEEAATIYITFDADAIRKRVHEMLDAQIEQVMLTSLGFENAWGEIRIDARNSDTFAASH